MLILSGLTDCYIQNVLVVISIRTNAHEIFAIFSLGIQQLVFYLIILCYKYLIVLSITKIYFVTMCTANHCK